MLLSFLLLAEENCRLINYKQKKKAWLVLSEIGTLGFLSI